MSCWCLYYLWKSACNSKCGTFTIVHHMQIYIDCFFCFELNHVYYLFFLQFYCSHLHILCSFKGHGLLTLFPHVPILNHIMVTGIFFLVVHQITGAEYAFMGILKPSPPGSFPTKDCPPNADAPQHAWCVNVSYFHVEELNTWTMA